ncbi:MAG: PDZ domain-containing protein [Thaumarchaeota archaeon]|nr:MAG: PDZ domain-containing protein [Nitrososphaerota archaeon]
MKKTEMVLIAAVIVLATLVTIQTTNSNIVAHDSTLAITQGLQGPAGPQGIPGPQGPAGPPGTAVETATGDSSFTSIFKKVENSVVQITSKVSSVDNSVIINGQPLQSQSTRLGSGFVYDKDGRIITNNHVVEGSKTVNVTFVDGNTYTAKVVGTDPDNDIAVIQIIDNFSDENLIPLTFGDSSQLEVGQQVIAIGNPFGLSDTMTHGIVSQTGRLLPNENVGFSIPDVIQVDAPINPGNSGGPLLNMQGEVIGMNTAIKTNTGDFSGIGFAIPSNSILRIIPELIKDGKYSHPWLGIAGTSMNPDVALANGLPRNYKGVIIDKIVKDGPADKAGITQATLAENNIPHGGDIITAVDGHPIKTIYDIISYMDEHKSVGDKVVLTINRMGKTMDLTVLLQARPASSTS